MAQHKKNYLIWALLCASYLAFIALFSFLYPYGGDEYAMTPANLGGAVTIFLTSYLVRNPRIGLLFNNIILLCGKWLFVVLNPLVQLALILSLFFLVYMRLPDFKTRKDIYPFALIMLLSVFAVAVPDNTLFWIGGACNYSWMFLVFILFLCLLRFAAEKGIKVKLNFALKLVLFFGGIVGGMSSENASPMLLIIFAAFFVYSRFKKIKTGEWFYVPFAGIILGLILLFGAPGSYYRFKTLPLEYIKNATLWQKIFWHLPRLNGFFKAALFLPLITPVILAGQALINRTKILKDKDFIYACAALAISYVLALVLFAVPLLLNRVFYGATVMALLAFIFTLKHLQNQYKTNLFKYVFIASFCAAAAISPLFTVPYTDLYLKDAQRLRVIEQAKQAGKTEVFIPPVFTIKGPTENLSLNYYDFVSLNNYDLNLTFGIDFAGTPKRKLLPLPQESF